DGGVRPGDAPAAADRGGDSRPLAGERAGPRPRQTSADRGHLTRAVRARRRPRAGPRAREAGAADAGGSAGRLRHLCGRTSHRLTVLPLPPAAPQRPSGDTATHSTSEGCVSVMPPDHVFVSHNRTVPGLPQSPPPLISVLPSDVKHTDQASPSCASRLATPLPLATSHTLTAPKRSPAARLLPSADRATPRIPRGSSRVNLLTPLPAFTSHRRAVPSELPDASREPSLPNDSELTQVLWPVSLLTFFSPDGSSSVT